MQIWMLLYILTLVLKFKENRLAMKKILGKAMLYGQQKQNSKTTGQQELFENKSEAFSVKHDDASQIKG